MMNETKNDGPDWWKRAVQAAAEGAGAIEPENTGPTADDIAGVDIGDWAQAREALGIDDRMSFGEVRENPRHWQSPAGAVQQHESTELDEYMAARAEGPQTSSVLGCASPTPRENPSPWRIA